MSCGLSLTCRCGVPRLWTEVGRLVDQRSLCLVLTTDRQTHLQTSISHSCALLLSLCYAGLRRRGLHGSKRGSSRRSSVQNWHRAAAHTHTHTQRRWRLAPWAAVSSIDPVPLSVRSPSAPSPTRNLCSTHAECAACVASKKRISTLSRDYS